MPQFDTFDSILIHGQILTCFVCRIVLVRAVFCAAQKSTMLTMRFKRKRFVCLHNCLIYCTRWFIIVLLLLCVLRSILFILFGQRPEENDTMNGWIHWVFVLFELWSINFYAMDAHVRTCIPCDALRTIQTENSIGMRSTVTFCYCPFSI